jgi:hypothetical protein
LLLIAYECLNIDATGGGEGAARLLGLADQRSIFYKFLTSPMLGGGSLFCSLPRKHSASDVFIRELIDETQEYP